MKTMIAVETVFFKTSDGKIWTTGQNDYFFWKRYLIYFKEVLVVARVKEVTNKSEKWIESSGKNVTFIEIPYYKGPFEYIQKANDIKKVIANNVLKADTFILRVPGRIASICWSELVRKNIPYFLEVCGDPWESLRKGNVKSIVRPFARVLSFIRLKRQCYNAEATSYVTNYTLQKRYPPNPNKLSFSISDVVLNTSLLNDYKETKYQFNKYKPVKIINAGSMDTFYKGHLTQIESINILKEKGYNVKLYFAGDGQYRQVFESKVKELSLEKDVIFLGMIPGSEKLQKELNNYDLFILPSYVEGMPRVLIEAMAVSLPCIATNVGGIPEVLNTNCLVEPRNPNSLADKIIELITDNNKMNNYSRENYSTALNYSEKVLNEKRAHFYSLVLEKGNNYE
ncbi:glycosyltransferase family 4 protein [Cytobacillus depressus]|uniref:Glycosyltransferase family 4 protein n=1 Tax=Cytobacillus depressus TaxID=1602942 RepID=A0A6L3V5R3_9BACI|nr:glycosyltransferase [Cytobacillus depressus]KAB2336564.1 glycosyltransferase family 4 protein [Cytobacillus depressus]